MQQSTAPFLAPATPVAPQRYGFSFHGDGGDFFVLLLKNVLLTIVTLGIYRAWAKTERRKFMWRNTEIHGHRLAFTGTGQEIFVAYLKLAGLYLIFGLLVGLAGTVSPTAQVVVQVAVIIPLMILIPYAIYWARAYLLSRTTWRGIRFGMVEGAGDFASTYLIGYLLTAVTLGIYGPFWRNKTRGILTRNARFGSEPFQYDGDGEEVFWISLKGFLLTLVTLGVYAFWMHASLQRYYFAHTSFGGARGKFAVSGGTLLKLFLLNVFGTTLTLGLAFPWISVYSARTILQGVSFEGHIDFDTIVQNTALQGPDGDVLADALDVGLGV